MLCYVISEMYSDIPITKVTLYLKDTENLDPLFEAGVLHREGQPRTVCFKICCKDLQKPPLSSYPGMKH